MEVDTADNVQDVDMEDISKDEGNDIQIKDMTADGDANCMEKDISRDGETCVECTDDANRNRSKEDDVDETLKECKSSDAGQMSKESIENKAVDGDASILISEEKLGDQETKDSEKVDIIADVAYSSEDVDTESNKMEAVDSNDATTNSEAIIDTETREIEKIDSDGNVVSSKENVREIDTKEMDNKDGGQSSKDEIIDTETKEIEEIDNDVGSPKVKICDTERKEIDSNDDVTSSKVSDTETIDMDSKDDIRSSKVSDTTPKEMEEIDTEDVTSSKEKICETETKTKEELDSNDSKVKISCIETKEFDSNDGVASSEDRVSDTETTKEIDDEEICDGSASLKDKVSHTETKEMEENVEDIASSKDIINDTETSEMEMDSNDGVASSEDRVSDTETTKEMEEKIDYIPSSKHEVSDIETKEMDSNDGVAISKDRVSDTETTKEKVDDMASSEAKINDTETTEMDSNDGVTSSEVKVSDTDITREMEEKVDDVASSKDKINDMETKEMDSNDGVASSVVRVSDTETTKETEETIDDMASSKDKVNDTETKEMDSNDGVASSNDRVSDTETTKEMEEIVDDISSSKDKINDTETSEMDSNDDAASSKDRVSDTETKELEEMDIDDVGDSKHKVSGMEMKETEELDSSDDVGDAKETDTESKEMEMEKSNDDVAQSEEKLRDTEPETLEESSEENTSSKEKLKDTDLKEMDEIESEDISSTDVSEKEPVKSESTEKAESSTVESTDQEQKDSDSSNADKKSVIKPTKPSVKESSVAKIESSTSSDDDVEYELDFDIDIEGLIESTIEELCNPEKDEDAEKFEASLHQISPQVKGIERKQREINKIFNACTDELEKFKMELEVADRDQELLEAAAEAEAKEAAEANAKAISLDSDDDDVQFISTSFDPDIASKQQQFALQNKNLAEALSTSPQMSQQMPLNQSPGQKTMIIKIQNGQQIVQNPNEKPTLQNLRAALAASLQKQMDPNLAGQQIGTGNQILVNRLPSQPITTQVRQTFVQKIPPTPLNPEQTASAYQKDFDDLKENSKIYIKKASEMWFKGSIMDIANKDKPVLERKYTVRFDGKGKKQVTAKDMAFKDPLTKAVCVGTRVIAMYKDDEALSSFYAGIVAETPNGRNQHRYLIFFDDGYAQYSTAEDIHKVVYQSQNVWEDIMPDSQEFIKEYLKQYPERPMVRLHKGQTVKTEWNGRWWTAKVIEVDASLVKMFFLADKRIEWIYRGSTRLEPLFTALANAEANRALAAGNKVVGKAKRHTTPQLNRKPFVEYTRGISDDYGNKSSNPIEIPSSPPELKSPGQLPGSKLSGNDQKKRAVAKKSTTPGSTTAVRSSSLDDDKSKTSTEWEPPWVKKLLQQQQNKSVKKNVTGGSIQTSKDLFRVGSISSNKLIGKDMASVLQERLAKNTDAAELDEEAIGERMESVLQYNRKRMRPHSCNKVCVKDADDPDKYKGTNPLLIPLLLGWERHVCKMKPSNKRVVMYKAPCARRLRAIEEVDRYLMRTKSNLTIDLFCFDPSLHTHTEFVPVKTFCDIKDMSYGKEDVPISCVNGIDRQYPDYVEYSNVRIPAKGVNLNLNPEFLVGCDCTDGCRTKSKCACQQLTVEATTCTSNAKRDSKAGFKHRRLKEPLVTGVYECNANCKCDSRCHNRVAQNGLRVRLQVFKTEKKGWGLRSLDDIPAGGFICIYAGQLLTDQGANEDGQQYGDEYLAELDYMEVVERQKEGYESDADMDEGLGDDSESDMDSEDGRRFSDSDSDFSGEGHSKSESGNKDNPHRTRMRSKRDSISSNSNSRDSMDKKPVGKLVLRRDSDRSGSRDEEWPNIPGDLKTGEEPETCVKVNSKGNKQENEQIPEDDSETTSAIETSPIKSTSSVESKPITKSISVDSFGMDSDELPDLDQDLPPKEKEKKLKHVKSKSTTNTKDPNKTKSDSSDSDETPVRISAITGKPMSLRARKSTSNQSRFKNLPDPRLKDTKRFQEGTTTLEVVTEEDNTSRPCTRYYFQDRQDCYIMDAKSMGNIGRYLNHSCSPNVFVQNVFVDSHDLRFPWVAFFAGQFIRAGTELTWDYNYEVGSVPGKILYCYCGSADCRGRLL